MYRDFAERSASGARPEMSLERAIEDQRLMDQIYATRRVVSAHYDIVIIGSGAGGGTIAHALAPTGARILILERGDFVPQEDENWSAAAVWKDLRYRTRGAVARRARRRVPALHALQRRRQHEVLGQRALPAAPRGLSGAAARRRRVAGVADRLRNARAVLRSRRAAVSTCAARSATIPPSRRAGRIRFRRCRTRPGMARLATRLRALGLHPSPLPLGLISPGDAGGLPPVQHLQLVPLPDPREERRRRHRGAARARRYPNVTLWTQRAARRG